MAEIIAKIDEVNSKSVNTSRGASTVYEVKADGKRFSTFKAPLGKAAAELRGQIAVIEYNEVQKGEFTNYYLEGVRVSAFSPQADTATVSDGAVSHNITSIQQIDTKAAQINRSVAFKGAVDLVAAGVLTIDGLADLDILTGELVAIVEGNYPTKLAAAPQALADAVEADLIKF